MVFFVVEEKVYWVGHDSDLADCIGALGSFGVGSVSMKNLDGFSNLDYKIEHMGHQLISHKFEKLLLLQRTTLGI